MLNMRLAFGRRLSSYLGMGGLSILAAGLFCAYLLMVYMEQRAIYRIVHQRADVLVQAMQDGGAVPSEFGYLLRTGSVHQRLPTTLQRLGVGYHLIGDADQIEHVVVRDVPGALVVAVYKDAIHSQKLAALARMFLGLFVALGAIVVVLSHWWAGLLIGLRSGTSKRIYTSLEGPVTHSPDARSELSLAHEEYQDGLLASRQCEREFIANVGHELRTPITLILTGCELLEAKHEPDSLASRQLGRIKQAAEHMDETVRGFLILARDGNFGVNEFVEVRACVLEALEPHEAHIKQSGLNVNVNVGVDVVLEANREAVFVVIGNLITNAIKYTRQGGINIQHLGSTLYVSDTGQGIDDGDIPKLFQPFFRSQVTAELGVQGLGLGLAIVKRICDHYSWSITVRSKLNRGSTFSIEFGDCLRRKL